jgi:histidine ammonia-lyase
MGIRCANAYRSRTSINGTHIAHVLRLFKTLVGCAKVRYRGRLKNATGALAMLALINIEKWGKLVAG